MMLSYYPGCSLEGSANEYDRSTRSVFASIGVELKDLEDWNCCGASSAHIFNEKLSIDLPARNLQILEKQEADMLVSCAACYSRMRKAVKVIKDQGLSLPDGSTYEGKNEVRFVLDVLFEDAMLKKIGEKVAVPLEGLKVVCYYGCLTVRPPRVTGAEQYENPTRMDEIVEILGATACQWSFKTECCGAGLALARSDLVMKLTAKVMDMAQEAGAEAIVVVCPMCHANLDMRQEEMSQAFKKTYAMPVYYLTELIGLAHGLDEAPEWLEKHLTDAKGLLAGKGLL
ncbi:MAG: CoB--CoM heterodisulfide reductase iron-sulfur subunit B family protein [Pseudomonadota bacterium]